MAHCTWQIKFNGNIIISSIFILHPLNLLSTTSTISRVTVSAAYSHCSFLLLQPRSQLQSQLFKKNTVVHQTYCTAIMTQNRIARSGRHGAILPGRFLLFWLAISPLFCSALHHNFNLKNDLRSIIGPVGVPFGFLTSGYYELEGRYQHLR